MKYQEIYEEYEAFLSRYSQAALELESLPRGSVVKKHITGKEYHYLQHTDCGKKVTKYIKPGDLAAVMNGLQRRASLEMEIETITRDLRRLEDAASILSPNMSRSFFFLRQCAQMDALPLQKRERALSFSNALTALEGLPAEAATEQNLHAWVKGQKRFSEFYLPALKHYGIAEVPYEA